MDTKASAPVNAESAMTTCSHTEKCCSVPSKVAGKIGKKWATSLAGFITGTAVASIVLIPWMLFQGKLLDAKKSQDICLNAPASPAAEAPAPAPAVTP
jgi:hypothetical protein